MTILITGAGLIGRLTGEILIGRGDKVVLVDVREPDSYELQADSFEACDVTNAAALNRIIHRHSISKIVHTAAMLSTAIRQSPVDGINVNVVGTANIFEAARRHNLGRVVYASSTTVAYTGFGRHGPEPIEEDISLHVTSERPASIYAATKLAGEHLALLYNELFGVDVVVLRYAAVLGGRSATPTSVPGRLLALLAAGGRNGGKTILDDHFLLWGGKEEFVDARDCARANVHALDAAEPARKVYNIAPGTWFSLEEFIRAVQRVHPRLDAEWPKQITTGFAGFPHIRPAPSSISAATEDLGFACSFSLEDTIRDWT